MHTCLLEFAGGNTRKALCLYSSHEVLYGIVVQTNIIHTFTLRIRDRRRHLVRPTNNRVDADLTAAAELFRVSDKAGPSSTNVEGVVRKLKLAHHDRRRRPHRASGMRYV